MACFKPMFSHLLPRLTSMVIRGKEQKRRTKTISFVSQKVRGIKSVNRLEKLFYVLHNGKILLVCVYRTTGDLIKKFLNMDLTECLPQDLKKGG